MTGPPLSVADVVVAEGGRVTFARFMEIALTHSTLGYYSRVDRLLRHGGDFSTAPALSPFFTKTVARLITELVDSSLSAGGPWGSPTDGLPCIVELGGGEGDLAQGILRHWETARPELREQIGYRIVEVGAGLRRRQMVAVRGLAAIGWDVRWGSDLFEACADSHPVVILGNEFLDAVPVHVVEVRDGGIMEAYVTASGPGLESVWDEISDAAAAEIELLFGTLEPRRLRDFTEDGILEISSGLGDLMRQAAEAMPAGSLVSVDYGEWFQGGPPEGVACRSGPRWELEGRARHRRSIRGYFKHQLVRDPLLRPGRQDLTADVDFAAVDLHGRLEGFETVVFTSLAAFLRAGGAEHELQALRTGTADTGFDVLEADRQATVLEHLLDDEDLGSAFKVMVQVRD